MPPHGTNDRDRSFDKRGSDAAVTGPGWWYGVEAERNPVDGQALLRRIALKLRDSQADGVILLLPDTRATREFRRMFAALIAADFPVPGRRAMELLAPGANPGGSAVVVLCRFRLGPVLAAGPQVRWLAAGPLVRQHV